MVSLFMVVLIKPSGAKLTIPRYAESEWRRSGLNDAREACRGVWPRSSCQPKLHARVSFGLICSYKGQSLQFLFKSCPRGQSIIENESINGCIEQQGWLDIAFDNEIWQMRSVWTTYVDDVGSLALFTRIYVEILACTIIDSLIKLHRGSFWDLSNSEKNRYMSVWGALFRAR